MRNITGTCKMIIHSKMYAELDVDGALYPDLAAQVFLPVQRDYYAKD
jgi:hypothetical protein